MPTLFVLCGLSFSGKTTLARRIADATGSAIVAYDELYATVERDSAITGLDEWYLIRGVLHEQARAHLAAGRSVVVDNLNEEVVDRAAFRAIADEQGAETIVVHVDAPLDVIAERRRRNDREPARGTTSDEEFAFVLSRFEPPTPSERWIRYSAGDDVGDWLDELQRFRATREA